LQVTVTEIFDTFPGADFELSKEPTILKNVEREVRRSSLDFVREDNTASVAGSITVRPASELVRLCRRCGAWGVFALSFHGVVQRYRENFLLHVCVGVYCRGS
jgi:hypothetical protein